MNDKILTFSLLILSPQLLAFEGDKYNPEQKAIFYSQSEICHAKYLGSTYDNMLSKTMPINANYIIKNSLRECILDGGKLDRRWAKHFPELSLLETKILKEKQEAALRAAITKGTPVTADILKAQESLEVTKELEEVKQVKATKAEEKVAKEKKDENDFYGFNWAPGIAVMSYNTPYIDDIRIDSTTVGEEQVNTIYIDREVETNIAIVLETHYLWEWDYKVSKRSTGIGLFAATNLVKQEGEPLTTFAIGPMFAVKDKDSSNGLSIGLAYFVDTDFKVLRDGLKDGSTTTFTDTAKAIRKVDEDGWMLMISSKF